MTPTLIFMTLSARVSTVVAVNLCPCDLSCYGLSSMACGILKLIVVFTHESEGSGACAVNRALSQPSSAVVSH